MMMWLTGNKKGFTLIEIMLSVVTLLVGTVLLYRAFFGLLDSYSLCRNYLEANLFLHDKLWQIQQDLKQKKPLPLGLTTGEFRGREKSFKWDLNISPVEGMEKLYEARMNVSWSEGFRKGGLTQTTYVTLSTK